ncbi:hypothetical protein CKA32_005493 [Geitlerinema sp. FC II]|nr:hypothetical protein CKA32_005493 [Geitlerinema sp. FC II]
MPAFFTVENARSRRVVTGKKNCLTIARLLYQSQMSRQKLKHQKKFASLFPVPDFVTQLI